MFRIFWWVVMLGVLGTVIGFAFLLGLSFGLSNNHDKFISETVPILSMLSGWVAGIGALAAVLTSLWLADKQRREDVESLIVKPNLSLLDSRPDNWFINVQVTSNGKRPAVVTSLVFLSKHAKHACHITGFMRYGSSLPVQLSYGEKASFCLEYGIENQLRSYVDEYCGGKTSGLKVIVSTNLNDFSADIPPHLLTINT